MSDNLDTKIAAALQALPQAEADEKAAHAAWQNVRRSTQQAAVDHAADLLHELGIHIGDAVRLTEGQTGTHANTAQIVDAEAFCWQGDDIPEMTRRVGITLTVRVALAGGRFSTRTHRRIMWLPPLPRGLRIAPATDDCQERNP